MNLFHHDALDGNFADFPGKQKNRSLIQRDEAENGQEKHRPVEGIGRHIFDVPEDHVHHNPQEGELVDGSQENTYKGDGTVSVQNNRHDLTLRRS